MTVQFLQTGQTEIVKIPVGAVLSLLPNSSKARVFATMLTLGVVAGPYLAAGSSLVVGPFTQEVLIKLESQAGTSGFDIEMPTGVASGGSAIARSAAQLAAAPSAADVALGASAQFYDPLQYVDSTHPWVYYSATAAAYVKINSGTTGASTANMSALGSWNLTTNVATAADGTTTFTPTSGVYPTSGTNLLVCVGSGTRTLEGTDNYVSNDYATFSPALGKWVRQANAAANIAITAAPLKGDGAGSAIASIPGAGGDYMPPIAFQRTVPVARIPDCTIGANGALTIGTQVGGGSLTFASTAQANGVNVTESGGTAPFVSTDVGRYIVVGGVPCFIASYVSGTQVTVNIPAGGISSATWATWTLGTAFIGMNNKVYPGLWVRIEQGAINPTVSGPGYAAGLYWLQMATAMTGTLFNNMYVPGTNTGPNTGVGSWRIPAAPVPFVGTTGGISSTGATAVTTDDLLVPGGTMGPYGTMLNRHLHRNNSSAGLKTVAQTFGGAAALGYATSQSTSTYNDDGVFFANQGPSVQIVSVGLAPQHNGGVTTIQSLNTAVDQHLITKIAAAASTDWIVSETATTTINPGI